MIDRGANLQATSDAARFSHAQATNTPYLESNLFVLVGAPLSARGHKVVAANGDDMGGFQAMQTMPDGVLRAASDHRKDGEAAGWQSGLWRRARGPQSEIVAHGVIRTVHLLAVGADARRVPVELRDERFLHSKHGVGV